MLDNDKIILINRIIAKLDAIGLNSDNITGHPGTTEKIAMDLVEVVSALNRIAYTLEEMNDKLSES